MRVSSEVVFVKRELADVDFGKDTVISTFPTTYANRRCLSAKKMSEQTEVRSDTSSND